MALNLLAEGTVKSIVRVQGLHLTSKTEKISKVELEQKGDNYLSLSLAYKSKSFFQIL